MTLDEAIKHCLEVAEQNEKKAEYRPRMDSYDEIESRADCLECAADHRQLAEWLTELKEAKRLLKSAVEAMKGLADAERYEHEDEICCGYCEYDSPMTECGEMLYECPGYDKNDCFKWRHIDEALALIGEDTNVPATADDIIVGRRLDWWISCEERLPEDNRPVLCYVRDITGEGSGYIIGSCEHSEFWFLKISGNKCFSFPYMRIKVTHWMPLPEPPKIGGADHENTV